jgi:hypothetical protein
LSHHLTTRLLVHLCHIVGFGIARWVARQAIVHDTIVDCDVVEAIALEKPVTNKLHVPECMARDRDRPSMNECESE